MNRRVLTLVFALGLFGGTATAADPSATMPRPARGARMYDPATVTTVNGEVIEVKRIESRRGAGVHVELRTASGTEDVHLGPSWYLDKQSVQVAKGDQIEVTGSRVTVAGQAAIVAQTVKKGDTSLTLRNASGVPEWAGAGRR